MPDIKKGLTSTATTHIERALSRFLIFAMLTLLLFVILNITNRIYGLASIQCFSLVTLPILYTWLKHGGSQALVKHALGFISLTIFLPLLFMPSIANTGIYWVFAYPLVAFFFLGVRTAIQWCCIYLALILCGMLMAYFGYIPFYYTWTQIWLSLIELLLVSIISYFFVSDNEAAEKRLEAHVYYLKSLDHIEHALHSQLDLKHSMNKTLETLLETFHCSRAWLLYPCDPKADTWSIPFERTVDNFPGALATGEIYPIDATMHTFFSDIQNSNEPICYDDRHPFGQASSTLREFSIQSKIAIALRPNKKQTWVLGLHQCDYARHWNTDEKRLFQDIAHRIEDALQQILLYQELKKSTQDLLQSKQQAEAANHAKSEFLSVMSHELRTPLHGIIGLQELIATDAQHLSSEQLEHIHLAQQAAKSLSELVNDILNLSKIESGNMQLNIEDFSLKNMLIEAAIPFVIACRDKKIPLNLHLKNTPKYVSTDPVRLRQVLINLIGNAVKFTKHGHVDIFITTKDNQCSFAIHDTGIGISKEQLTNIFEPFHQEAQLIQAEYGGTGLGTTIAKRFIHLMGGEISVHSELGKGSCFTFNIPCKQHKGDKIHWQADLTQLPSSDLLTSEFKVNNNNISRSPIHILIAEDDPIGQHTAAQRLRRAGMIVDSANDGLSAWEKVQTGEYHLLLTDIRMPKLDGIALTKRIRQAELEKNLPAMPIIGLSAHALSDIKKQCLDIGMNAFISKPVHLDSILKKIQTLIAP